MKTPPDRKIFEAAASWYVQFQTEPPTPAEQAAWQQWLESDPAHRAAWLQMEQLQSSLGRMPVDLTRRALSAPQQRRDVLKWMLVLGGTGYLGWNVQQHTALKNIWADYRTPVGGRRQVDLADDSQLELNTDTAINIAFDGHQRLVHLLNGEILVRTGKSDDHRPFYVQTAQGRIQALGTHFSVRQLKDTTRVGVLEDRVSIVPAETQSAARVLNAGESADFNSDSVSASRSYPQAEAAWVNGQLIVLNARLGDVINELARYRPGVMHCDESVMNLRVSGAFRLDSTDAVLANLQATLPIRVKYFTRYWVSVQRIG